MTRRPILLLVNTGAGGKPGAGDRLDAEDADLEPDALAAALSARGLAVSLRVLERPRHARSLARDGARDGYDVVAVGGDGTVSRVAAALLEAGRGTLGIVPLGSFNNIARGIGLPESLSGALDVIGAGTASAIDVGWAYRDDPDEGKPFFEAAGVGVDAIWFLGVEVAERHGWWRGARTVWRAWRRGGNVLRVSLDEEVERVVAPAVIVSNGPYHGMGFAIGDGADPTDGRLNVAIFERMGRLEVLRHFVAVARRRSRHEPRVRNEQVRKVTVESVGRAVPAHADGESLGVTPVSFAVRPAALRVFR
jgi:diacylglycerol kinase (ATP)